MSVPLTKRVCERDPKKVKATANDRLFVPSLLVPPARRHKDEGDRARGENCENHENGASRAPLERLARLRYTQSLSASARNKPAPSPCHALPCIQASTLGSAEANRSSI